MSETAIHICPESFYQTFDRKDGDQQTTHYCPGCGHGIVHKYLAEAIDDLGMQDRTILVSPVGCSVFAYYYFDVGNVQVPHGRSPAAATGIKRAHPDSLVIGYQGDGDLAAIGANEIVQAANRGENISVFFINNAIYGMTGGQMAPTTLMDTKTTTTPSGRQAENEGFPLRVCELLGTLSAPYYLERVAIGDNRHNAKTRKAVRKALRYQVENRGFSLVEVLSPCPTGWKLPPVEATERTLHEMTEVFPLGVYRDGHELPLGHPRNRRDVEPAQIPKIVGVECEMADAPLPDHRWAIEDERFKISGFGGQGVLLMGLVLSHAAMLARREVSWMPSYGPEMRGGTAYCNVTVSDEEIGSPVIEHPTVLVAMNGPSLERFGPDVEPGGTIFYNSSLIDTPSPRRDVKSVAIPANRIAEDIGSPKVANMVMLGAVVGGNPALSTEAVQAAVGAVVHTTPELDRLNAQALAEGIRAAARAEATPR